MPISADTGATVYGGKSVLRDDPSERLPGWPNTGAVLQSRRVNFTPTTLGTTIKVYTSPTKRDIVTLAKFFADWGATIDIEEGPFYKLTVNLPWDEFSQIDEDPVKYTLWEIVPQASERDIYEVGIFSPQSAGGALSWNRQHITFAQKGAVEYATKNPMMTVNLSPEPGQPTNTYLARTYLALKRLRADGVQAFTQTVKRSVVLYARSITPLIDPVAGLSGENISQLISSNDLAARYNVPTNIRQFLLPSYSRKRNVSNVDGVDLWALAGYLIKKPTVQQISPAKIQYSQEFIWDEWLDSLYRPYDGMYQKFPPLT